MKRKSLLFALLVALFMPWAAQAQEELTVCEGTTTNSYIPVYGLYVDTQGCTSEFIIPAETEGMSDMEGGTISKVTFYISEIPGTWGSPVIQLYLGEVEGTTLSSISGPSNFTVVKTMVWSNQQSTIEVEFDEPYTYEGGNLLIGTYVQTKGSYKTTYFLGVSAPSGSSRYSSSGPGTTGTAQSFLPKTTFTYEPAQQGGDVCEKPATLVAENVTGNSATLTWTGGSGVYNIELNGTIIEENYEGYTYSLRDLAATTAYTAKVQSVCDGSTPTSTWKTVSFTTPCASYDIPYTYGFEDAAPYDCWTVISGTVSRQSGTTNSGSYRLDFRGTTSNMIALPQFNEATNNLRVEFYTRPESTGGSSGKFAIGYMTDITDASTFVAVETYNSTEMTTNYVKKTVDFVNVPANANIAMRQFDCQTNYYWYVDDVTVKEIPSCVAPSNLAATVSTTSVELSWTANSGETAWTLYWKESGATDYTEVANATNPYTLNGLTAATNYEFYVVANCSADDASEASEPFPFVTACDVIDALGFEENFDDYTVASNYIAPSERVLPTCWSAINTTTYGNYKVFPTIYYYSSTNYANSTPNCLKFYSYAYYSSGTTTYDPQPQYAILPEMTGLAGTQVQLKARGYLATSTFKIGTMSDPTDASTFVAITEQTLTTSYQQFEYVIPANASGSYLAIMIDAATASRTTNGAYIDDIVITEAPACTKPMGLEVVSATTTTVTLRWTASGDETAWQICLDGDEENLIMANSNPFTVEGLTAATAYTAKVRAYCDEDNQSDWSDQIPFATECDVIATFPWMENFNSLTAGIPVCWDNSEGTTTSEDYKWNYNNAGHDGAGLRFNSYSNSNGNTNFLKTPTLSLPADQVMQLTFWYKNPTGGDFSVYISTDGGATYTTALATGLTGVSSWTEHPVIYLADYAGQEVVIVFKGTSNYGSGDAYIYLDDVTVMEAPTCLKPTDVEVTTNALTATITWVSEAGEYDVAYSTDNTANPDENIAGTATEETYTMSDLALGDHYFWVRANCGSDGYSEWVGPVSAHIGYCVPAPSSVDGNGISNVTFGMGDNIVNNDTPKATYADYSSQIGAVQAGVEATIAITYATGYTYGTIIWVDLDNSLSFEESEIVYTGTSENPNPTTLNATITIPVTVTPGDYMMRIAGADGNFDDYIAGTSTTAPNPCYTGSYACFQDYTLRVLEAPSCMMPTGLAINYTGGTEAIISWTSDAEAWNMRVNGVDVNGIITNPYTLTGLELATTYSMEVQANCGEDGTSEWSNAVSFTTDLCLPENQCEISYSFYDQYDDSWNEAYMNIVDATTGEVLYELTMPDVDGPYEGSFNVCDGRDIQFVWVSGSYPNECGYEFTHNGETILEKGTGETAPSAGVVLTYTVDCGFASYTLEIEGYEDDANEGGYYLIASPVTVDPANAIDSNTQQSMIDGDYDLYSFDQAQDDEWRNYKQNAFSLEPGKGYLYAHKTGGEFTLTGTAYSGNGEIELVYDDNAIDFKGWNLVGNPWGVKAYPDHAFYTMAEGGAGIDVTPNDAYTEVAPMTGIFVVANGADQTVTFATENPNSKNAKLALNLTNSNKLVDRAIVRFGEGQQLPKFQLNPNHTKVYFQQEGKDYAIVNATEMGEMPVSFKAESNGSYTLSVNAEEVSFAYLHLIDNMTGVETDLLSAPSYSFEAKSTDYANRFKLVFATGNNNGEDFAFFSNGSFVINNEGNATLQVVDVTGRILKSESINGCASVNVNAAPGVYMLRLVNGENVKVQKVVVR